MHYVHRLTPLPMHGFSMKTFAERMKWLRQRAGLKSKSDAANAMHMNYGTYQGYEYGLTPSKKNYKLISSFYGCSLSWLMTGEGDPFSGSSLASSPGMHIVNEKPNHYENVNGIQSESFSISEDVTLAVRVLESRTHYATALHLNIRSFSNAIDTEKTLSKCHEDMDKQAKLIKDLQYRIDAMQEEIKELKKASGGCPPVALGLDHAAPTGTEDNKT